MTGPASGGLERGTGAPARSTGTQGAVGAILIVLALGLALRVIIAYLLPGSGFQQDLDAFRFWASDLAEHGLGGFYQRDFFHDYTPGYMLVLWVVGVIGGALGAIGDLIKVPPILADLAIGWLVWSMVRELGGNDRLALGGALVAVLNPVSWFDSVVWGQVDAFGVVFLLLALRSLWRDRPERAAIFTVLAAIIKPQLGILVPLIAVVTIRRALWPVRPDDDAALAASPDPAATGVLARLRAWERRTGSPWRILTTGLAGLLTAVVISFPFGLSVVELTPEAPFVHSGLVDQIVVAGGGYPYLSVNAYNLWAVVSGDTGSSLASGGQWVCDAIQASPDRCGAGTAMFGPVPAVAIGAGLLILTILGVLWVAARRPDRLTLLVALAVLALAFFAVPTRVHERYGFPFFALGAILFAISVRWRIAYVILSVATFLNMYVVLTTIYPGNPSISDWLRIGPTIRETGSIVIIAILGTVAFVWALLQLRSDAHARLTEELAEAGELDDEHDWVGVDGVPDGVAVAPGTAVVGTAAAGARPGTSLAGTARGGAATAATASYVLPTWTERRPFAEAGFTGWFRDRLAEAPARADRSAALAREGGGRLDRLDAFLLVVLVLTSFGMRTFRLEEPYQMHFDEVYHARTATEFLQGWRYGLDHDIYEWTHPHLAKYAMAGGLVLWGGDHVQATSELGVPVRAVAIEHRRDDVVTGRPDGERVHVATGTEIRTYDLVSRELVGITAALGASALAVDPTAEQLVVGYDDGRIATFDLTAIGLGGTDNGLEAADLVTVDHPITHLLVTDDGSHVIAASDTRLSTVDVETGSVTGTADLAGIADLAEAGTGSAILATPSAIDDRSAVASKLAELLDGDAADFEGRLSAAPDPEGQVVLGTPGDSESRDAIQAAIDDGTLAGVDLVDLPRIAVATAAGVAFVDPTTAGVTSTMPMVGGAHGLAKVTGIDDPRLYVTNGPDDAPGFDVIAVGGDSAKDGPVNKGHHPLPGPGTSIAYDEAAQQVHILGRQPSTTVDGVTTVASGWTVYVVEPHADAVYADAALPDGMTPAGWAMDVEPMYPAGDRQQLLVFGTEGTSASIDVGSHAFAWRLPGVIAGSLMAGFLYLLARILFRRRLVAGLVAAFVLLDGMLFVQSRIGMNDVYVGLFIIAAYTLFAAIWTGWWKGRGAFWIAMPVIGVLLGLALASKWVAAYAIGALVLLLLIRSALGRVLAILGLIGITSVLGYMAVNAPEGGLGNVTFLLIMIGLTLLAVVVAVMHPIAWTREEQWFALVAPAALGALVFVGGLVTGKLGTMIAVGSIGITVFLSAVLLAFGSVLVALAFTWGGRLGYGPLAEAPAPDDPRRLLDPPDPAPDGWLRPGWLAGLPMLWAAAALVAIPLVVYVISYIPWALIDGHQLWPGVPAGHEGQTLLDLTRQMYGYHNGLTSPHPASSPWWAWPFDLKPVWFYQESFAGGTTAAIYDAGNLVIWWIGAAAMVWISWMAYRRRSLALALIAIGFAAQWIPWARIDRAAFQYHYYTALPFLVLGLAYFVAELWHGADRKTWLAARVVGGVAIVAPALMWLFTRPLCAFVGVESVNPGSAACPPVIPDLVLTLRVAGLIAMVIVAGVVLALGIRTLQQDAEGGGDAPPTTYRNLIIASVGVMIGFLVVALLPDTELLRMSSVPVEPIAFVIALPLAWLGAQVVAARDARRYVVGLAVAILAWFVVVYPNISALPLPSAIANAYQGLLPTYLYAFQFPVSTADRTMTSPLLSLPLVLLTLAIGVTCVVVAYSASVWRLANAESRAISMGTDASLDGPDGLARTGGGA